tara:strand:- start:46 stop:195 length:150 start_codon:yes stop_codon:yes gene_type:complete
MLKSAETGTAIAGVIPGFFYPVLYRGVLDRPVTAEQTMLTTCSTLASAQ